MNIFSRLSLSTALVLSLSTLSASHVDPVAEEVTDETQQFDFNSIVVSQAATLGLTFPSTETAPIVSLITSSKEAKQLSRLLSLLKTVGMSATAMTHSDDVNTGNVVLKDDDFVTVVEKIIDALTNPSVGVIPDDEISDSETLSQPESQDLGEGALEFGNFALRISDNLHIGNDQKTSVISILTHYADKLSADLTKLNTLRTQTIAALTNDIQEAETQLTTAKSDSYVDNPDLFVSTVVAAAELLGTRKAQFEAATQLASDLNNQLPQEAEHRLTALNAYLNDNN